MSHKGDYVDDEEDGAFKEELEKNVKGEIDDYVDRCDHLLIPKDLESTHAESSESRSFSQMAQSYYDGVKRLSELSETLDSPITIECVNGEIEFTIYAPFMDKYEEVTMRSDENSNALDKLEDFVRVVEKMKSFYKENKDD